MTATTRVWTSTALLLVSTLLAAWCQQAAATDQIFEARFERAYAAAEYAINIMRANIKRHNPDSIEAYVPATPLFGGADLRLFVVPVSETETRIFIDPENRTILRNYPPTWSINLFREIDNALKHIP